MDISDKGLALTKGFESCRLTSYQDVRGIWTIGFGHTGTGIGPGITWTQEQADAWLKQDMGHACDFVNGHVTVVLSQDQFDSLCDLVYNIGSGNFEESTLLRKLNDGDVFGAAEEFQKWDMAGGQHIPGLLRRRIAERDLFIAGC